jgi:hypothetical protein
MWLGGLFMRIRLTWSLVAILALAVAPLTAAPDSFGTGVSLAESTEIGRILQNPSAFEGQTLRVEGVVSAVCTHMGCWMSLVADGAPDGSAVLIKVDDGVIVFPVTAKGRRAAAQGVVQRVGGDPEGQSAAAEHAKETGAAAAPVTWQIKATGAVVY